jgi:hypothetical protein
MAGREKTIKNYKDLAEEGNSQVLYCVEYVEYVE